MRAKKEDASINIIIQVSSENQPIETALKRMIHPEEVKNPVP
jgi:hypothetical protein